VVGYLYALETADIRQHRLPPASGKRQAASGKRQAASDYKNRFHFVKYLTAKSPLFYQKVSFAHIKNPLRGKTVLFFSQIQVFPIPIRTSLKTMIRRL
jgi:hypothetical protein